MTISKMGQGRPHRATTMAALLASSTLALAALAAPPAHAQTAGRTVAAAETVSFSIPAQPLSGALRAFIRATGWQVGYAAGLLDNRRSQAVSGRLTPGAALQSLLSGTGIAARMTGDGTVTLVDARAAAATPAGDGATVLDTILVQSARSGVVLGTGSAADTGTSTITGGQITARSEGGDANGILRNLPNVQYQNDVDDEAGATDQSVIDLRPREVSISGARVYENNFILNGMDINTVTGSQERYGSSDVLEDGDAPPNADRIFDLHSQTIYVPTDFVDDLTVIDSNASARYGNFQGGVVSYKLKDAPRDRLRGSIGNEFTTSDWTGYEIGTESGLNPNDVARNDYIKRRWGLELGGPVTDNIAVIGQYSRQTAVTHKDKDYRYTENRRIEEDSRNEFYRGQVTADTDYGDFTLEGVYTRYHQIWENANWRNMQVDLAKRSFVTKLQHDYEFEDFTLGGIGFSDVKLTSKLGFSKSDNINDKNGTVARVYDQTVRKSGVTVWEATEQSDWCRTDPSYVRNGTLFCYDGATGDLEQGQERWNWSQEMKGDVLAGSFLLGLDYTRTDAYRRRPEEVTYYTNYTSIGDVSGISAFVCNTTEECSAEQYAANKGVYKAFDIKAGLNEFATYAELEQSWKWLEVRGGLRLSYDDYMNNLNLAPRFVATVNPFGDFAISAGVNRYYDANSLAFAIRDKQPKALSYRRSNSGATVNDAWTSVGTISSYINSAADLKTPYSDEFTLSIAGTEPLFDGHWRLRYLDRRSKDQFATQSASSAGTAILTNDASSAYQSVTAEYTTALQAPPIPGLDSLAFNTSATWSRREKSNNSYFEEDLEDNHIWYKERSYTEAGFGVVTGNMDIPLRLQAGLSSTWLDDTLNVSLAANYNFGYTGAKYTENDIVVNGVNHEIWADYDFSPTLTFDLAASYTAFNKDDHDLTFTLKVENLLNETGNATATTDNPWLIGRTVWVGAKATF